jgi:hypothetical protein
LTNPYYDPYGAPYPLTSQVGVAAPGTAKTGPMLEYETPYMNPNYDPGYM